MKRPFAFACLLCCCSASLPAKPAPEVSSLASFTPGALAGQKEALKHLRAAGPSGLAALFKAAEPKVTALRNNKIRLDAAENASLRAALDGTAGQRDAYASGLYWFTDLEAAKAEAAKSGRRILSLRLLGRLDEEYSCANSRFFRTVLYANKEVSAVLRERYVLHWNSERPAPLLTIDMGDGRRIKRTITGNSIHYLLNARGEVLDALPGIYSPAAFLAALERAARGTSGLTGESLRLWHGTEAHRLCMEWLTAAVKAGVYGEKAQQDLANPDTAPRILETLAAEAFPSLTAAARKGGFPVIPSEPVRFGSDSISRNAIDALIAERAQDHPRPFFQKTNEDSPAASQAPPEFLRDIPLIGRLFRTKPDTVTVIKEFPYPTEFDPPKAMVERPVMKEALPGPANEALDPASPAAPGTTLSARMTPQVWSAIAEPFRNTVRLDEASRRFMLQKLTDIATAEETAGGAPAGPGSPFGRMLQRFEAAIARDMVRNEFYYHTQIHQWLEEDTAGTLSQNMEALNRRVYNELFQTPDYDAWLGLVPEDTYTALERDGCACDKGAPPMRPVNRGR